MKWHLQTGGKAVAGRQNLWRFNGSATEILDQEAVWPFYNVHTKSIPPQDVTVAGEYLDTNGILYKVLPDDTEIDVTPTGLASIWWTTSKRAKQ